MMHLTLQPVSADPVTVVMAAHARLLLAQRGLSIDALAQAIGDGRSRSAISRDLNIGVPGGRSTHKAWTPEFAARVAAFFGLRPDELAGRVESEIVAQARQRRFWNARLESPRRLLSVVAEAQDKSSLMVAVCYNEVPTTLLDVRLQRTVVRELVGNVRTASHVKGIKSNYNAIATARRNAHENGVIPAIRTRIIVCQSAFDRVFLSRDEGGIESREAVAEGLDYLMHDVIGEAGVELIVVNDQRLPARAQMDAREHDGIAIFDDNLAIQNRLSDHTVSWSTEQKRIQDVSRTAKELEACAVFDWKSPRSVIAFLDQYRRRADRRAAS